MNPNVVWEIADLALAVAKTQASRKLQQDAELAAVLLQIIPKAVLAYQEHTGETLDPSLIRPEDAL